MDQRKIKKMLNKESADFYSCVTDHVSDDDVPTPAEAGLAALVDEEFPDELSKSTKHLVIFKLHTLGFIPCFQDRTKKNHINLVFLISFLAKTL